MIHAVFVGSKCTPLDYPVVTKEMSCGVKNLKNHIIFMYLFVHLHKSYFIIWGLSFPGL